MTSNEISSVTMIGALPPLKGNAYYCMRLSSEIAESTEVNFISFKRLYPNFLYPGGVIDSDRQFKIKERKNLKIWRTISYLNPVSWIRAALLTSTSVVHLQWWSLPLAPVYLVILLFLRLKKKKIIFTVHNVVPHEKSPIDKWLTSMVLSFGNKFIVHTMDNREKLAKVFQIPKASISVMPTPANSNHIGDASRRQKQPPTPHPRVRRQDGHPQSRRPVPGRCVAVRSSVRQYPPGSTGRQ